MLRNCGCPLASVPCPPPMVSDREFYQEAKKHNLSANATMTISKICKFSSISTSPVTETTKGHLEPNITAKVLSREVRNAQVSVGVGVTVGALIVAVVCILAVRYIWKKNRNGTYIFACLISKIRYDQNQKDSTGDNRYADRTERETGPQNHQKCDNDESNLLHRAENDTEKHNGDDLGSIVVHNGETFDESKDESTKGSRDYNICLLSYQKCEHDESNLLHRAENDTEKHNGDDLGSIVGHNGTTFDKSKDETTQGSRDDNICLPNHQKCKYDESNLLHTAENDTEKHNGDDLGSIVGHNDKTFDDSKDETTQGSRDDNICLLNHQKCEYDESKLLHTAENDTEKHNGDDLGSVVGHNNKTFDEDESTQGSRDGHNDIVKNENHEEGHFDSEAFESDRLNTESLLKINSGIKDQMENNESESVT